MKTLLQQELKQLGILIRLYKKLKKELKGTEEEIYYSGKLSAYKDMLSRLVEVYKKL